MPRPAAVLWGPAALFHEYFTIVLRNMVNRHHSGFLLDNRHQKIIENAMLNCPVQTKGLPYFDFQGGSVYILRENF